MVVFIHIANVLYLYAYLVKDILWLRVLTVAAGLVLLGFYAWMPMPIWAGIIWNILFTMINVRQIQQLLVERRPARLRPEEARLYEIAFRRLTERGFAKLLAIGQWREFAAGDHLVQHGEAIHELVVLASGRVRVMLDGKVRFELRAGCFVGEMSFVSGKVLDADVVAMEPTRTLSWQDRELRSLLDKDAELRAALSEAIGEDLVAKLRTA
jgi:CRP-like cAMP-binding protein